MFTQDYQICVLRAQRNVLWDVSLLESLLHNYRTHSKKLRLSCDKPFGKVVKTESYVSTRSYWIGTFFEILIIFFGCQNRLLRVQMVLLDKNTFRNFFQYLHIWTVSSNFSDFRQNIQWLGCPNCLLRVQRRFLKEKIFARKKFFPSTSDFELIIFAYLANKSSEVYHSLISWTPCKSFRTSCEEFFAGITFMHYTPQREFSAEFSVWNLRFTFTDFMR